MFKASVSCKWGRIVCPLDHGERRKNDLLKKRDCPPLIYRYSRSCAWILKWHCANWAPARVQYENHSSLLKGAAIRRQSEISPSWESISCPCTNSLARDGRKQRSPIGLVLCTTGRQPALFSLTQQTWRTFALTWLKYIAVIRQSPKCLWKSKNPDRSTWKKISRST